MPNLFQISVLNVPFDREYTNTLYFASRTEQEEYFNVSTRFDNAPYVNFSMKNFYRTTVIYKSREDYDCVSFMNKNYCIIKNNNENKQLKYLYYFIDDIKFDSGNQIVLDLSIDIIQTYFIDMKFNDCIINRAHLDRFYKESENIYKFDFRKQSNLFIAEDTPSLPKYEETTIPVNICCDKNSTSSGISELDKFIENYVDGWLYVFLDADTKSTEVTLPLNTCKIVTSPVSGAIELFTIRYQLPYYIICAPIYKPDTVGYFGSSTELNLDNPKPVLLPSIFDYINKLDNKSARVYDMKFSRKPPFIYKKYTLNTDYKFINYDDGTVICSLSSSSFHIGNSVIDVTEQSLEPNFAYIAYNDYMWHNYENSFELSRIKDTNFDDVRLDPKTFSEECTEINFSDGVNQYSTGFSKIIGVNFDYTKLPILPLLYYEIIDVGVTRYYLSIKQGDGTIFPTDKNFTGLVGSNDFSIPYSVDRLNEYLANNKNYYIQNATNAATSVGTSLAMGVMGHLTGALTYGIEGARTLTNMAFTADNMRNAPDLLKNGSGSPFLYLGANSCKIYCTIYRPIESDLKAYHEKLYKFGYNYNRLGNVKDFVNKRKVFSYVKADVENVDTDYGISEYIHDETKRIFKRGIRFWNKNNDDFNYRYNETTQLKNNYEVKYEQVQGTIS